MLIYGGGSSRAHRKPLNTPLKLKKKKISTGSRPSAVPTASGEDSPGQAGAATRGRAGSELHLLLQSSRCHRRPPLNSSLTDRHFVGGGGVEKKKKIRKAAKSPRAKQTNKQKPSPTPHPQKCNKLARPAPGRAPGHAAPRSFVGRAAQGTAPTAPARSPAGGCGTRRPAPPPDERGARREQSCRPRPRRPPRGPRPRRLYLGRPPGPIVRRYAVGEGERRGAFLEEMEAAEEGGERTEGGGSGEKKKKLPPPPPRLRPGSVEHRKSQAAVQCRAAAGGWRRPALREPRWGGRSAGRGRDAGAPRALSRPPARPGWAPPGRPRSQQVPKSASERARGPANACARGRGGRGGRGGSARARRSPARGRRGGCGERAAPARPRARVPAAPSSHRGRGGLGGGADAHASARLPACLPARGRDKERGGDRRAGPCALGRRASTAGGGGGRKAGARSRGAAGGFRPGPASRATLPIGLPAPEAREPGVARGIPYLSQGSGACPGLPRCPGRHEMNGVIGEAKHAGQGKAAAGPSVS